MGYLYHLLILLCIYAILAYSLDLLVSYLGYINFSHASLFALGAYGTSLLMIIFRINFIFALIISSFIVAFCSIALVYPASKTRGSSFIMTTLAIQAIIYGCLLNLVLKKGSRVIVNGSSGISGIDSPVLFANLLNGNFGMLIIFSLITFISIYLIKKATNYKPWKRLLLSIKSDEDAVKGLNKDIVFAKVEAFFISGMLASIAGGIYASYIGYIDPQSIANLDLSIIVVAMIIVGGKNRLYGPLIGAILLILMQELPKFLQLPNIYAPNIKLGLYGLALILSIHFQSFIRLPKATKHRQTDMY